MLSNIEMYGRADLDAYAAEVQSSEVCVTRGLSAIVTAEIATAQDEIGVDPVAAQQALNRARYLIARLCPLALAKEANLAG